MVGGGTQELTDGKWSWRDNGANGGDNLDLVMKIDGVGVKDAFNIFKDINQDVIDSEFKRYQPLARQRNLAELFKTFSELKQSDQSLEQYRKIAVRDSVNNKSKYRGRSR